MEIFSGKDCSPEKCQSILWASGTLPFHYHAHACQFNEIQSALPTLKNHHLALIEATGRTRQPRVPLANGSTTVRRSQGPTPPAEEICVHCAYGSEIIELWKSWTCSGCQTAVRKKSFCITVQLKEALALLAGKTSSLKGVKSRAAKKFDAESVLDAGKLKLVL